MLGVRKNSKTKEKAADFGGRRTFLLVIMFGAMTTLLLRAIDLQVLNNQFLKEQGKNRHIAKVEVSAYRGKILDRNGKPLAISTPVESIYVDPQQFVGDAANRRAIERLAALLDLSVSKVRQLVNPDSGRRFNYLKRQVNPALAAKVNALHLPGVYSKREFKRFYPTGEVTAHLLGFTDIDDVGQEGLELNYEPFLKGRPGSKRVIRDGKRRIIADVEDIRAPVSGQDLVLSIDQRLQYLAYRAIKAAVKEHKAHAAAVVVLDAKNGDLLAAANQPSFNPNTRKNRRGKYYRNRAIADVFEPGSTVKPFVVACALDGGYIRTDFEIDTSPGWYSVGRNLVKDVHNYGKMDLTKVLKKSSNVAVSKIALKMPRQYFWECYNRLGFGTAAGVGFPGEASGALLDYQRWHPIEQATLSFGYGVNVSLLQLARAYTALADDGILHSVSLLKRDRDDDARRVISAANARLVRTMLEQVVRKDGTAYRARVDGYRVAGKTGTVKKASAGGYTSDRYIAVFVGMAPASDPRLIVAVMVDEPSVGAYYGGLVAGPVFSRIMADALRVMDVAPDQEQTMPMLIAGRSRQ